MVCDALLAANPVLGITEMVDDPRQFVRLDDSILKQIEYYGVFRPAWQQTDQDDSYILEAQGILKRLRERDLYRYCGEWVIPPYDVRHG